MQFERPKRDQQIGAGMHKKSFLEKGVLPLFVTSEFRYPHTPAQTKSVFYISNIIHELFPQHTVHVTQSGKTRDGTSLVRTEYVPHDTDPLHRKVQHETLQNAGAPQSDEMIGAAQSRMDNDQRVQEFMDQYEATGFYEHHGYLHGWGGQDAVYSADGTAKFVDVNPAWYEPEELGKPGYVDDCLTFNPAKLRAAICALPLERKERALTYYNRLMTLCREVGFTFEECKHST